MAAAAYKINMTVLNDKGQMTTKYLTASDVNAAYWIHPSGATEIPLSTRPCWIKDIIYSAAGTDTSNVSLFVNGSDTGLKIVNSANVSTVLNRGVLTNPIFIPQGAFVKFVQNT